LVQVSALVWRGVRSEVQAAFTAVLVEGADHTLGGSELLILAHEPNVVGVLLKFVQDGAYRALPKRARDNGFGERSDFRPVKGHQSSSLSFFQFSYWTRRKHSPSFFLTLPEPFYELGELHLLHTRDAERCLGIDRHDAPEVLVARVTELKASAIFRLRADFTNELSSIVLGLRATFRRAEVVEPVGGERLEEVVIVAVASDLIETFGELVEQ